MLKKYAFILLASTFLLLSSAGTKAHAACTDPVGAAGDQLYNSTYDVMQYCNNEFWISMGGQVSSAWTSSGTQLYYDQGNVGIGNTNPLYPLHVTGETYLDGALTVTGIITAGNAIRLSDDSVVTDCDVAGDLRYNASKKTIEICDSSDWKAAGVGEFSKVTAIPFVTLSSGNYILSEDDSTPPALAWDTANDELTLGQMIKFTGFTGGDLPETAAAMKTNLGALENINITEPISNGDILEYKDGNWVNTTITVPDVLEDLSDVTTTPATGDVLIYNTDHWENSSQWQKDANSHLSYTEGNVGIGIDPPTAELEVAGRIKDATGYIAPPGTIVMFGGTTAPDGWLLCDGSTVSSTTYADLYSAIGTNFGGDASNFALPDMRSAVPRGAGTSENFTEDVTTSLGTYQDDALQGHKHILPDSSGASPVYGVTNDISGNRYEAPSLFTASQGSNVSSPISDGSNGTPRIASETRMKNVGVNFIIKY